MDVNSLASGSQIPQFTTDSARALMLRVGQQMTATILEMGDSRALLDVGRGVRLVATVQADQQLESGQTVQLEVTDNAADQVTLRLVRAPASGEPMQAERLLQTFGLKAEPANSQALRALIAEGLPINKQAVQDLRATASALAQTQPEDLRAIAFLVARGLSVTSALVAIVRQGLSGANILATAGQLRQEAAKVLAQLGPAAEDEDAAIARLRSALEELVGSGRAELSTPADVRRAVMELATSLEAVLANLVSEAADEGEPAAAEGAPDQPDTPSDTGQTSSQPASLASTEASPPPAPPRTAPAQLLGGAAGEAATWMSPPASNEPLPASGSPTAAPASEQQAGAENAPLAASNQAVPEAQLAETPPSLVIVEVPAVVGPEGANSEPATSGSDSTELQDAGVRPELTVEPHALPNPLPVAAPPQAPADTHLAARQMLPALEQAIASGALPDSLRDSVAVLRDHAVQLVQHAQFQQLQNGQPASAGGPDFLTFALPLWSAQHGQQGELYLFIQDQAGGRKIDPDDMRLVMQLHMTRLQRLTITVHVLRRQIMCHIETDAPGIDRLFQAAAPELRERLQALGYSVPPISCSPARPKSDAPGPQALELARVNVRI